MVSWKPSVSIVSNRLRYQTVFLLMRAIANGMFLGVNGSRWDFLTVRITIESLRWAWAEISRLWKNGNRTLNGSGNETDWWNVTWLRRRSFLYPCTHSLSSPAWAENKPCWLWGLVLHVTTDSRSPDDAWYEIYWSSWKCCQGVFHAVFCI